MTSGREVFNTAYARSIKRTPPRTVAFYKYSMMEEFGIKSSAELVQFALTKRIVSL